MSKKPNRLSLALDFACATITIMFSGYAADVMIDAASALNAKKGGGTEPQPTGYICVPKEILRQFFGAGKCKGLVTSVALETKRPNQVVTGVLRGYMGSLPVAEALISQISDRLGTKVARSIMIAPIPSPKRHIGLSPDEIEEFKSRGRYHGIASKVARDLGTKPATVSTVAHGKLKSTRILAALRAEMKRADGETPVKNVRKQTTSPFTSEDLCKFRTGRYRGLATRVARSLGISKSTASQVIRGNTTSAYIVAGVRAEVERIDAERAK